MFSVEIAASKSAKHSSLRAINLRQHRDLIMTIQRFLWSQMLGLCLIMGVMFKPAHAQENADTVRFQIKGMSCKGCSRRIDQALKKMPGIRTITVSFKEHTALVGFDPAQTTAENIRKAIEDMGYKVRIDHAGP